MSFSVHNFTAARLNENESFWHTLRKEIAIYLKLLLIRFMHRALS